MPSRSGKISFTRVTWYSQVVAIVLFVGIYCLGFYVGSQYEMANNPPFLMIIQSVAKVSNLAGNPTPSSLSSDKLLNNVTFMCPASGYIAAQFLQDASGNGLVDLELSDGRIFSLPQTISADGARYANASQSFVFWNKGKSAFIEENGTTTWSGCVTK